MYILLYARVYSAGSGSVRAALHCGYLRICPGMMYDGLIDTTMDSLRPKLTIKDLCTKSFVTKSE